MTTSPTPFYADDSVALYLGDFREVLPTLDLSDVGMVLADPPYGETALEWDRWPAGWPGALAELLPDAISMWCFGSMRMFLDRGSEFADWRFAQDVVWEKHNGSSSSADRFRRVHELALQWYRGEWGSLYHETPTTADATARTVRRRQRPPQWGYIGDSAYRSEDGGPRLARSVQYARSMHGKAIHPTEKPLGILELLLSYSLPRGGVVLDPFAGSAATLRAAKVGGWRAIGVEAREDYCLRAVEALAQGSLFEAGA